MTTDLLSYARARELFEYDDRTGLLRWKIDRGGRGRKGRAVGTLHRDGYLQVKIGGKQYLLHRVIWLWYYGFWPMDQIDHVNGCRSDNRLVNLRQCTNASNQHARPYASALKFPRGVRVQHSGRFQAQIQVAGRKISLGTYDTPEEAAEAYGRAAKRNYGDFAWESEK